MRCRRILPDCWRKVEFEDVDMSSQCAWDDQVSVQLGATKQVSNTLRRGWGKNEAWVTVLPAQGEAKPGFQGSWSQWSCPCWLVIYSSRNSDCASVLVELDMTAEFNHSGCNSIFSKAAKVLLRAVVNWKLSLSQLGHVCVTGKVLPKHKAFSAYVSTSVYPAIPPNYWSMTAKLG